jgi:hypothetical protein
MASKKSDLGQKSSSKEQVLSYDPINFFIAHYFWNSSSRGVNTRAMNDIKALKYLYPKATFTLAGADFGEGMFDEYEKVIIPLDKSESVHSLRGSLEEAATNSDYVIVHNALRGINPYTTKALKEFTEILKEKPVHYVIHDGIWDHPEDWGKFNKVFEHTRQAFPSTENFTCSVLTPPAKPRVQNHYNGDVYVIRNSVVCDNFSEDPRKDDEFDGMLVNEGILNPSEVMIPSGNRIVDRKAFEIALMMIKDWENQTGRKSRFVVTESIDPERDYPALNTYQRVLEHVFDKHGINYSFGKISKFVDDKNFNIGHLYRNAARKDTFVPFPSEIEGFGFTNVEAPLSNAAMVGRYLTTGHPDMERRGMNFNHFFDDEAIRSFPIDKWVDRMKYADNILSDKKAFRKFSKEFNLMGRIEDSKAFNDQNKAAIRKNYDYLGAPIRKLARVMEMPGHEKLDQKVV